MQKRRHRPAALEYAVFGLTAFLAMFLLYELAKRRVKAPVLPPPPAVSAYAPAPPAAPEAPGTEEPSERAGRGPLPPVKAVRAEKVKPRRAPPVIPAPVR